MKDRAAKKIKIFLFAYIISQKLSFFNRKAKKYLILSIFFSTPLDRGGFYFFNLTKIDVINSFFYFQIKKKNRFFLKKLLILMSNIVIIYM